jgi:hypothetical protein
MDEKQKPESKRKLLIIIGLLILLLIAVTLFWRRGGPEAERILGPEIEIVSFTERGKSIGKALLYVSFLKSKDRVRLNAFFDLNSDGNFEEAERLVKNFSLKPRESWRSGIPFSHPSELGKDVLVKIVLDTGGSLQKSAKVGKEEAGALLDLATVKNPEESMKGWGGEVLAADPVTQASRGNVPDLTQRIAECAPTAAANNIISLAEEHGVSPGDIPTPTEIVDGLKGDMKWTPADGVLPDNFVKGKNEWAAKNGLPIRTRKVGDANGATILTNILDAMAKGGAAEARIRFSTPAGKVAGGHMVTVTGVRTEGGQTFIDVNDPKTPQGTETYEVNGNIIEDYPSEFLTTLSWGFVQVWEGTPTGTTLEPLTEEEVKGIKEFVGEKTKIKVIVVGTKKIPLSEVHVGKGPECDSELNQIPHWHANSPAGAKAIDGSIVTDPGGCGYGKVQNVPVEEVEQ